MVSGDVTWLKADHNYKCAWIEGLDVTNMHSKKINRSGKIRTRNLGALMFQRETEFFIYCVHFFITMQRLQRKCQQDLLSYLCYFPLVPL